MHPAIIPLLTGVFVAGVLVGRWRRAADLLASPDRLGVSGPHYLRADDVRGDWFYLVPEFEWHEARSGWAIANSKGDAGPVACATSHIAPQSDADPAATVAVDAAAPPAPAYRAYAIGDA